MGFLASSPASRIPEKDSNWPSLSHGPICLFKLHDQENGVQWWCSPHRKHLHGWLGGVGGDGEQWENSSHQRTMTCPADITVDVGCKINWKEMRHRWSLYSALFLCFFCFSRPQHPHAAHHYPKTRKGRTFFLTFLHPLPEEHTSWKPYSWDFHSVKWQELIRESEIPDFY